MFVAEEYHLEFASCALILIDLVVLFVRLEPFKIFLKPLLFLLSPLPLISSLISTLPSLLPNLSKSTSGLIFLSIKFKTANFADESVVF